MSYELNFAKKLLGQEKASILMTDGYKFSMAQAGFALRKETFTLVFRKGGPFLIPFDLNAIVQALRPELPTVKESAFLTANGYGLTPAMEKALGGRIKVWCPPAGSWIGAGEPVLTITGPSFLVSWLEPLVIMLQYPIQIATSLAKTTDFDQVDSRIFSAPCADAAAIVDLVAANMPRHDTDGYRLYEPCQVEEERYRDAVFANAMAIGDALEGHFERAFEVGLRAATCVQQHLIALEECQEAGIKKTSHVYGAWKYYMIPVGTTGHEHQMRWAALNRSKDDAPGYRAIRDLRPEPPSYLFDTFNPLEGISQAYSVIWEDPQRPCSLRFDSGDQDLQFKTIKAYQQQFVSEPAVSLIFEDGYDADKTSVNERVIAGQWPQERVLYGYGGFLISKPFGSPYNRDTVSAAYKLSRTGGVPVMKFSGTPGKRSLPGKPVIWQKVGQPDQHLIAQEDDESIPDGWEPITASEGGGIPAKINTSYSRWTEHLIERLSA